MTASPAPVDCPYVGLAPFDEAHAAYFFGRGLDSDVIADNALARPVTVLFGASGVGKSSVLNVGLPRALAALGAQARIVSRREWHEPDALGSWLDGVAADARATPSQPLILVLDQFEEYFLYPSAAQVERFARGLAALLARPDIETHLLFALRDDGLHRLDAMRVYLPGLLDTTLELRHLDEPAVREAIERPVAEWNRNRSPAITLDPDFADTLIGQLRPKDEHGGPRDGGRIELAYLQLALERIWEAEGGAAAKALRTRTLTETLKGVGEIARRHVEGVLAGLAEEADRELCATVFDRLVTPSGGKILYRLTDLAEIAGVPPERMEAVLAPLAQGRGRILRAVDLPEGRHGRGYEILHDILAGPILDWREHRAALAREQAAREQEARNERERQRNRRIFAALLAFSLIVVGLSGVAAWLWRKAESLLLEAESTRLMAAADRLQDSGYDISLLTNLLAIQALPTPDAKAGLLRRLVSHPHLSAFLPGHSGVVRSVAFSPDGSSLASASLDGNVFLWNPDTLRRFQTYGHKNAVYSVAFSPDGRRLASASEDKTVILWDLNNTRKPLATLEGHKDTVYSVAFSPDGKRLASASGDKTVILWDLDTRKPLATLEGHKSQVTSVVFSPDGRRLASASGDRTVILWDLDTRKPLATLEGHKDDVESVAFSPDGRRLASASSDSTVILWDLDTRKPLA